jgi:hypothetical protein
MTYKTATNTEEAINVLKDEKILSMNTKPKKRICKNIVHEFYRCSSSVECPVKACVVYKGGEDLIILKVLAFVLKKLKNNSNLHLILLKIPSSAEYV